MPGKFVNFWHEEYAYISWSPKGVAGKSIWSFGNMYFLLSSITIVTFVHSSKLEWYTRLLICTNRDRYFGKIEYAYV